MTLGVTGALSAGPITITGGTLNVNASGTVPVAPTITGGVLALNAASAISGLALTISGGTLTESAANAIAASSSLTVTSGSATLSQANNYTGATTVNNTGTLTLSGANAIAGSALTVSGSAVVTLSNSLALGTTASPVVSGPAAGIQLTGGISVPATVSLTLLGDTASGNGTLSNLSGTNSWAGPIAIPASTGITRIGSVAGTLTVSGNITMAAGDTGIFALQGGSDTGTLIISGAISGPGPITRSSTTSATGLVILSGNNTFTGVLTVGSNILNIQSNNALGATGTSSGTLVNSGATLQLQNNITVGTETLTINASGVGTNNNGALENVQDANSFGGSITLGTAARINSDAGTLTLTGSTISGAFALTFGGAGAIVVADGITTPTSVTKDGTGTVTLVGTQHLHRRDLSQQWHAQRHQFPQFRRHRKRRWRAHGEMGLSPSS